MEGTKGRGIDTLSLNTGLTLFYPEHDPSAALSNGNESYTSKSDAYSKEDMERTSSTNSKLSVILRRIPTPHDDDVKSTAHTTKAPYIRPTHPKVKSPLCNLVPDGFRGENKLGRHMERSHTTTRKVWVILDASLDKKFLANCQHCRNKKAYGAYGAFYNAAAHLRGAHFSPRKRGRKGRNDEKHGGKGGGDHPPMDCLK